MSSSGGPKGMTTADRLAILVFVCLGFYVVIAPNALGWDSIREQELEFVFVRVLVGFLFLFLAGQILERHRARLRINEIQTAMNMLLYGRNYKRDREAIRILITALDSKSDEIREKSWENLKQLTGLELANDPDVWRSWWAANEKFFALKGRRVKKN